MDPLRVDKMSLVKPCSAKTPAKADPATTGVATATRIRLWIPRRKPTQRRALPRTYALVQQLGEVSGRMSTTAEGLRHRAAASQKAKKRSKDRRRPKAHRRMGGGGRDSAKEMFGQLLFAPLAPL
jgi:hypothetical protein